MWILLLKSSSQPGLELLVLFNVLAQALSQGVQPVVKRDPKLEILLKLLHFFDNPGERHFVNP